MWNVFYIVNIIYARFIRKSYVTVDAVMNFIVNIIHDIDHVPYIRIFVHTCISAAVASCVVTPWGVITGG